MTLKPGAWVDPARMLRVIRDAGFTPVPEDVRLVVTGTLSRRGTTLVLVLDGMTSPRELVCVVRAGGATAGAGDPGAGASGARPPGALAPDEEAVGALVGASVVAEGRWIAEGAGRLELTSLRAAGSR